MIGERLRTGYRIDPWAATAMGILTATALYTSAPAIADAMTDTQRVAAPAADSCVNPILAGNQLDAVRRLYVTLSSGATRLVFEQIADLPESSRKPKHRGNLVSVETTSGRIAVLASSLKAPSSVTVTSHRGRSSLSANFSQLDRASQKAGAAFFKEPADNRLSSLANMPLWAAPDRITYTDTNQSSPTELSQPKIGMCADPYEKVRADAGANGLLSPSNAVPRNNFPQ